MPLQVKSLAEWEREDIADMLSVVIPAHNEEGHIADTVEGVAAALQDAKIRYEILVVNDKSVDRTETIVRALDRRNPAVRCINNDPPNGFGFAVRRGFAEFRGEVVAIFTAVPNSVIFAWMSTNFVDRSVDVRRARRRLVRCND